MHSLSVNSMFTLSGAYVWCLRGRWTWRGMHFFFLRRRPCYSYHLVVLLSSHSMYNLSVPKAALKPVSSTFRPYHRFFFLVALTQIQRQLPSGLGPGAVSEGTCGMNAPNVRVLSLIGELGGIWKSRSKSKFSQRSRRLLYSSVTLTTSDWIKAILLDLCLLQHFNYFHINITECQNHWNFARCYSNLGNSNLGDF